MFSLINRRRKRALLRQWFDTGATRTPRPDVPLVFVPSMFGIKLDTPGGRCLWGDVPRVFTGPPLSSVEHARPHGVIDGFLGFDLYGGTLRFLEHAGGYHLGRNLFILDHDWRRGVVHGARALTLLLEKLRARGIHRFDLAAFSSGGLMARYALAYGMNDARTRNVLPAAPPPGLRRLVYIGTPHRGGLSAIYLLWFGHHLAPRTRIFPPDDIGQLQIFYDLLPHPDEPVACDTEGADLPWDLYHPDFWSHFRIPARKAPGFREKLDLAARMYRALHRTPSHPDTWVIGARHQHTARRLIVREGRLIYPEPWDPDTAFARSPGDGALLASSLTALPELPPERVRDVDTPGHIELISQPDTRVALLRVLQERTS